ncbi:IPT/TIG domain-containing protein [Kitasatospora azatica]|uniref:IPT/TIG domain-containing protein n=1 Tax=Kitasatospora azatica TaxID=58347 RepID=UPI001E45724C|nr:IPT/TIG domain-containing protein [Kitasatospora azatica]
MLSAAPALTSISPNQGAGSGGTSVTLTGTNLVGTTSVKFGTAAATSFVVVSGTQIAATAPPGSGTVQVTATTPGGTSNGVSYTYLQVPTLSSLAPDKGPVAGGNTVTLTGTNLTNATAVSFGATVASFVVVSATQIIATAPTGSAGPVNVTVTTPGGTSNGVSYTYLQVPTLSSLAPDKGPVAGGNTVTLTGTNLTNATAVSFGATTTPFVVVSATQIAATAPTGSAGPVNVTVTTPGGTSNALPYFLLNPPTLSSLAPDKGPVAGGNTVTLTGTNLTNATAVSFGATTTPFVVVSATQIIATVPPGGGTVQVTATTPGGTSNGVSYTYLQVPTLSSLAPDKGPVAGGSSVTLTGTNLTNATAVSFGATVASFVVVSATQIIATAPTGSAGPVNVTVTTPGGTSNALPYSRVQPPGI